MRVAGGRESEDGEGKIAGIDLPAFFMFEKQNIMSESEWRTGTECSARTANAITNEVRDV